MKICWKPQQLRNQLRMQCSKEALEISSSSAIKNMVMGGYSWATWWVVVKQKFVWKGYSSRDWEKRVSTKTENIEYHHPWLNVRWKDDRTDWWAKVPANLFLWCPVVCSGSSGSPGSQASFVVLPRIRGFYWYWIEFRQLRLCFLFQPLAFLIEIRCAAHCHLTVCKCKPCQQRKPPALTDSFSRVMTPTLTPLRPGL